MDWKDKLALLKGEMNNFPEESTQETEVCSTIDGGEENEKDSGKLQKEPLKVITDRKGRKGKTATIIEGFIIAQEEVEKIAKVLKQKLGVGGSVREGEILIQGEHKEAVKNILSSLGFKVKLI